MATVKEHYDAVLAEFYTWLYGGLDVGIATYSEFFRCHKITPAGSGIAIDLGAGSGFQSIPLATIGFAVTAIDLNEHLLKELTANSPPHAIRTIQDDLLNFDTHVTSPAELIICMTDTLLHLESKDKVRTLVQKVFTALATNGKIIVTFRDLTQELTGLDRFLPVRSDPNTIFTCFLEYGTETVTVHDITYSNRAGKWQMLRSCYQKLRLSGTWLEQCLVAAKFNIIESNHSQGLVTIIAGKSGSSS